LGARALAEGGSGAFGIWARAEVLWVLSYLRVHSLRSQRVTALVSKKEPLYVTAANDGLEALTVAELRDKSRVLSVVPTGKRARTERSAAPSGG
jgi:hypothetical protein